jgi:hypothetical protein
VDSLKLGMKQGLEGQARAQRQHDLTDTSNRKAKLKEIYGRYVTLRT